MNNLQITYLDPASLRENPWNPNQVDAINEEKLINSIDEIGLFKPILCRELEDGSLEILGGQHRNRAALLKGMTEVPVLNLGPIDEKKAKKIGLIDNGRYGEDDIERLAEVFAEIGSADEIVSILPIDISEFENIFGKDDGDLDYDDLSGDDLDGITADSDAAADLDTSVNLKTHQIMRFKVALEDAPAIEGFIRKIQREQGFTDSDSLTNAGDALVFALGSHQDFEGQ